MDRRDIPYLIFFIPLIHFHVYLSIYLSITVCTVSVSLQLKYLYIYNKYTGPTVPRSRGGFMGKGRIIGAKVGGEGRGGKGGRNIFLDGLDGLIGI